MKPESLNNTDNTDNSGNLKKTFVERVLTKFAPNLMLHRHAERLPILIHWRRVFILPTKPGLFFGFVTFLMLVASLNFNNNMGLMMTFLLVGLAQVALYRVFFNLRSLVIYNVTAKPVFLGDDAVFSIHLKASESKYDITLKNGHTKSTLLELPADRIKSLKYKILTVKRGWLTCGKIKVETSYPFGLFFAWIWTKLDCKCLVYPHPEQVPPPLPTHAQSEGQTNVFTHGEEFHGLKPYQSGDSMRLIAWKKTAQTGVFISREFQQTQGEKLLLDFSQISLSDVEMKLSRLTAWVLKAKHQELDYCLKLPQFNSDFGYSDKHHLSCLKALALFGMNANGND